MVIPPDELWRYLSGGSKNGAFFIAQWKKKLKKCVRKSKEKFLVKFMIAVEFCYEGKLKLKKA